MPYDEWGSESEVLYDDEIADDYCDCGCGSESEYCNCDDPDCNRDHNDDD